MHRHGVIGHFRRTTIRSAQSSIRRAVAHGSELPNESQYAETAVRDRSARSAEGRESLFALLLTHDRPRLLLILKIQSTSSFTVICRQALRKQESGASP